VEAIEKMLLEKWYIYKKKSKKKDFLENRLLTI